MDPTELKRRVEAAGGTHFSRSNMRFFGDRMANYGVRYATVDTYSDGLVEVWELYRKRRVNGGLESSAYFCPLTFARVHPKVTP